MKVLAIKNGLWNAFAAAAGAIMWMISSILIVNSLTPVEYGKFSYYVWVASILNILGTLAFPSSLNKLISELRGNQQQLEANALSCWVMLGLVIINLFLTIAVLIWSFNSPALERQYLLLVAITLIPNALTAVLRSTLWGREHYKPVSINTIVASLLQLAFIVAAYLMGWGVLGFAGALLSLNIIQAIGLVLIFSRRFNPTVLRNVFHLPKNTVLRRYFLFATPATLVLIYEVVIWQRSEIFLLERMSVIEQVGFYNLSYSAFSIFLTLGVALINGFFPAISKDYGAGKWGQIQEKINQGLTLSALFAVPLSFGGWAVLDKLVILLYGSKMLPAVPVAQVLLIGLIPGVIAAMLSLTVNAIGGVWLQVRLGAVMVALNIVLNLLLIPRFGALGAALANTGTQVAYTALLMIVIHRRYKIKPHFRMIGGVVFIGACTTFLVPKLIQSWIPGVGGLIGAVIAAGCVYATAVWGLGYLQPLMRVEVTQ